MNKILILLMFTLMLIFASSNDLKMVINIFRHGARSPTNYIKDHSDAFMMNWEYPEEVLTSSGMRQHYLLGKWIKQNYMEKRSFLSPSYSQSEVKIYSTPIQRTLESAQSFLQGIYDAYSGPQLNALQIDKAVPPLPVKDLEKKKFKLGNFAFPAGINAIEIQITRPEDMLFSYESLCDALFDGFDQNLNSEVTKELVKDILDKHFDVIQKYTVFKDKNSIKFMTLYYIIDNYLSDLYELLPLDQDLTFYFQQNKITESVRGHLLQYLFIVSKDNMATRVSKSIFFRTLLKYFDKRIEIDKKGNLYNSDDPKMISFAAHDLCLIHLQNFIMKSFPYIENLNTPEFADIYSIELESFKAHEGGETQYSVTIQYNDDTFLKPILYEEFKSAINKLILTKAQIQSFCKKSNSFNLVLLGILATMFAVLFAIFVILNIRKDEFKGDHIKLVDDQLN